MIIWEFDKKTKQNKNNRDYSYIKTCNFRATVVFDKLNIMKVFSPLNYTKLP